jgi:hypothetical protein
MPSARAHRAWPGRRVPARASRCRDERGAGPTSGLFFPRQRPSRLPIARAARDLEALSAKLHALISTQRRCAPISCAIVAKFKGRVDIDHPDLAVHLPMAIFCDPSLHDRLIGAGGIPRVPRDPLHERISRGGAAGRNRHQRGERPTRDPSLLLHRNSLSPHPSARHVAE